MPTPRAPGGRSRRPTMADVARHAGVSPTTVSFVINDRPDSGIPAQTRERVLEAVRDLGYRPNHQARSLRTRSTRTVGFLTDEAAVSPFAGPAIEGAHEAAWEHRSLLVVVNCTRDARRVRTAVDDLLERNVDAIVFAAVGTRRVTLPEPVGQVPAVLLNCYAPGNALPCVLPDEEEGGRAAARMLLEAGHRRIACLPGLAGSWAMRARLKSWHAEFRAASLSEAEVTELPGQFTTDSGYERTRKLLRGRRRPPTALLCGNDRIAMGAYLAILEQGLRIPHDISVVGYDDQPELAAALKPSLSTVRLPYHEMGQWAVRQMLTQETRLPPRTMLPCPPRPRASVAPPRAGA